MQIDYDNHKIDSEENFGWTYVLFILCIGAMMFISNF